MFVRYMDPFDGIIIRDDVMNSMPFFHQFIPMDPHLHANKSRCHKTIMCSKQKKVILMIHNIHLFIE